MSIEELPLFPLKTVLFPRMPLPLHIFEPRYKEMIGRCIAGSEPFGVVLIREGAEVGATAVPENTGTVARIHAVAEREDGEMDLLAEGTERFRIRSLDSDSRSYLIGQVERFWDDPAPKDDLEELLALHMAVKSRFNEYFDILVSHAGLDMPAYELPEDPEDFSFVIAAVIDGPRELRQGFLETTHTAERLRQQVGLLDRELTRLRAAASNAARIPVPVAPLTAEHRQGFFSRN